MLETMLSGVSTRGRDGSEGDGVDEVEGGVTMRI